MSRYEPQPMTSHPMRVRSRSPERTTRSIAAPNIDTMAWKTAPRGSVAMYQTL
jgi:hypothetical protein